MKNIQKQRLVRSRVKVASDSAKQRRYLLALMTGIVLLLCMQLANAKIAPLAASLSSEPVKAPSLQSYIGPTRNMGLDAFENGKHADAASILRPLALAGDAESQYYLGVMHDNGAGVSFDIPMAVRWYRKAAQQGHSDAQYNLGIAYSRGEGIEHDMSSAIYWWRKAGMQGNLDAQFNLGVAYSTGRGIERDYLQAIHWWRKAARLGDSIAQYNLGALYAHGVGVDMDMAKAAGWWQRSAAQGNQQAKAALRLLQQQQASR